MFQIEYVFNEVFFAYLHHGLDETIALEKMTRKKSDLLITGQSKIYHEACTLFANICQKDNYSKARDSVQKNNEETKILSTLFVRVELVSNCTPH